MIKGLKALLVLNNRDGTLGFAGSLMEHMALGNLTDADLLSRAKGLHSRLVSSVHRRVTPSCILSSDNVPHVYAHIIILSEGIFRETTVSNIPRPVSIHPLKRTLKACVLGRCRSRLVSAVVHWCGLVTAWDWS